MDRFYGRHLGFVLVSGTMAGVLAIALCHALGVCGGFSPAMPGPQELVIVTKGGRSIPARYYPPAMRPAPVIVLAASGSGTSDWEESGLVRWLQNRDIPMLAEPGGFAPLPRSVSFGVLVYAQFSGWKDAGRAAIATARSLPGADPDSILTFGSSARSITAAAVCTEPGCVGSLLFSPTASYDGIGYGDLTADLQAQGRTVWCISTDGDKGCPSAGGAFYREIIYPGGAHGEANLTALFAPRMGNDILAFLNCALDKECAA